MQDCQGTARPMEGADFKVFKNIDPSFIKII